jgi:nicotinamide riboside kinase
MQVGELRAPGKLHDGGPSTPDPIDVKIAFIGSHGVGKTTLCFDVAARLKRLDLAVDLVKEVARACPLPINRDTTLEAQAWILHTQVAEEIAAAARYEVVVCDRSVLDNYAYLVHQVGRRPEYEELVRSWMGSYDGLFKVPIIQPPSFDGTRDTSGTFQYEVDRTIDELMEALGLSCHLLDPGDRDGWVDRVMQEMGLPLRPPQMDIFSGSA